MDIARRQFMTSAGSLGIGLLAAGVPLSAFAQQAAPDLSFVHPELRQAARSMAGASVRFTMENLAQMRAAQAGGWVNLATGSDGISVSQRSVPVPGGPAVTVYVINAGKGRSRPAILHMHGGGYFLGSARSGIPVLKALAAELDCTIATVDYRLAPETRYTGSLEDNYAGLRWMYRNAAELGIDPKRIAVMGESAGGGHAALLALAARDRGEVPLCLQVLIYPMLDDRTGSSRAPGKNIGTILWTAEANRFGWEAFLGRKPGGPAVPTAGVPARVTNLAGLAPAFIGVGGIDLFVEEDVDYARRLISSGVPTELLVVPGAFHGFDIMASNTNVGKRFNAAKVNALRQAFATAA